MARRRVSIPTRTPPPKSVRTESWTNPPRAVSSPVFGVRPVRAARALEDKHVESHAAVTERAMYSEDLQRGPMEGYVRRGPIEGLQRELRDRGGGFPVTGRGQVTVTGFRPIRGYRR